MATKPGWAASMAVVIGLAAIGATVGLAVTSPSGHAAASRAT